MKILSRILLAISAISLAVGAHFHTRAFDKTAAAAAESNLPAFLGNGLKVLWLQDSVITNLLAIIFAIVAIKPTAAPRWIVMVLALVPIITACLVYSFIGNFYGAYVFLTAGVAAILGPSLKRAGD
ncbi:MAG TPA: hypothetical protein VLK27_04905 [Chthoniobacterales bacterium]|nr:hypothetical protein [Chthoniobacterales bacterium]